jgi:hypothetical protein
MTYELFGQVIAVGGMWAAFMVALGFVPSIQRSYSEDYIVSFCICAVISGIFTWALLGYAL